MDNIFDENNEILINIFYTVSDLFSESSSFCQIKTRPCETNEFVKKAKNVKLFQSFFALHSLYIQYPANTYMCTTACLNVYKFKIAF